MPRPKKTDAEHKPANPDPFGDDREKEQASKKQGGK